MKNRTRLGVIVFIAISLFCIEKIIGQTVNSWGSYIHVYNYAGVVEKNAFTVQLGVGNKNYLNSELSIAVKVNSPIENSGSIFNAEKLKIRLNKVPQGLLLPGASTVTEYQLNDGSQPVEIIKSSANLPQYGTHQFSFDIIVEGGAYLEDLLATNAYNLGLTFYVTIRTKQGTVFKDVYSGNTFYSLGMQIHKPLGGTPPQPTFMLEVNTAARNGLLELKTMRDYIEGVSQTYKDGLSVNSTTDYSIEVRSLKNNFEAGNNTVPVNAVSLEIKDSKNNGGGTIVLSENTQTVFNTTATGKQARLFDIRYFTTPNDERLINATPASYQTTLMYTLVPK